MATITALANYIPNSFEDNLQKLDKFNVSKEFIVNKLGVKTVSRMIYSKTGVLIDNESIKIFRLYDGKVINKEKSKINVFKFDQIDFAKLSEKQCYILTRCVEHLNSEWSKVE